MGYSAGSVINSLTSSSARLEAATRMDPLNPSEQIKDLRTLERFQGFNNTLLDNYMTQKEDELKWVLMPSQLVNKENVQ